MEVPQQSQGGGMQGARRGRITRMLLAATLALAVCADCLANAPSNLRFEQFGLEQGLPQETVNAVLQDRLGYLWFGTQIGLVRHDGYSALRFRSDAFDQNALTDGWITTLFEDAQGALWVGTRGGLHRYDPVRRAFDRFLAPAVGRRGEGRLEVRAIAQDLFPRASDASPALWVATADGLQRLNTRSGQFEVWQQSESDPASLPSDDVRALVWDAQGRLWIGTGAGLARLSSADGTFERHVTGTQAADREGAEAVHALAVDATGTLWLGTATGLEAWQVEPTPAFRQTGESLGAGSDAVRGMHVDGRGRLWAGTAGGLLVLDDDGKRFQRFKHDPRDPSSLGEDRVESLWVDRSGILWVGTLSSGASRADLHGGGFERVAGLVGEHGSSEAGRVYAIAGRGEHELWLGTVGGGLLRLDRRTGEVQTYRSKPGDGASLPSDVVRAVCVDPQGMVWAGTDNGLARLDPGTGRFLVRRFDAQQSLLDAARKLDCGREESIWVATEGGLHHYRPTSDTVQTYRYDAASAVGLTQGRVLALLVDSQGTVWAGTDTGLNRLDPGNDRFSPLRHVSGQPDSLSHSRVHALLEDRQGRMWVGTAAGLNRLEFLPDGNHIVHAPLRSSSNGSEPVGAILQDAAGLLWISSTAGITRYDPASGQVRTYTARDGLIPGSYYIGSGYAAPDGQLYFGGIAGLTAFLPESVRDNEVPPPVLITELQVFNRPVLGAALPAGVAFEGSIETAATLRLSPANSVFSLEFAAPHFSDPQRNQYAYRLVGFDPEWIETDASRRFVTYTNLAPDNYRFEVKASNKDGVWNEEGASLAITIDPPYWATWWFRSLTVLLMAALLWALYRLRVRGLTRHQVLLAEEVRQRTAEVVSQKEALQRRKESLEQAHETLSVLGDIGREITAVLDESTVLRILHRHVQSLLDATSFAIYQVDDTGKRLESGLVVEEGKELAQDRVELDSPTRNAARCARERRELRIDIDPAGVDPSHVPGTLRTLSALFVPLMIGERLLGVMTIQSPRRHAYGEHERVIFWSLCAYGAIALDNAAAYRRLADADAEVEQMLRERQSWLEKEVGSRTAEVTRQKADLEQAHRTLSVLGEIGREITAKLDETEVCQTLDQHVHDLLDVVTFAIYLLDERTQCLTSALRMEAGAPLPVASIALDHPTRLAARCARERSEFVLDLDSDEVDPSHVPGTVISRSMLFAPLVVGERLLGVMTIQSPRQHAYGERERLVFRSLCAYGAIALANAATYRQLHEADAEVQRILRERQGWLEQEVESRTSEVVRQKEHVEQAHTTLSVLGDIGREITATLDEAAAVSTLDRHVHALLDATTFVIYRIDAADATLVSILDKEQGTALPSERIALNDPDRIAARCARERSELRLDFEFDQANPSQVPGTLQTLSALFAPLIVGERLLGVMTIQSPRSQAYGEREQVVFRTLCAYGAIALDNAAAYRRLAEAEVHVQRMLHEQQLIFDNVAAAVFFVKERTVHRCNRGMEEMLGYAPGELIGCSTRVYHASDASWEALDNAIHPAIQTGEVAEGEWEVQRKDGTPIWIAYRGRALDTQDEAQGSIWVAQDITDRKRTEAELERIRREQQVIFDNSPGGGILMTRDRWIVRCNPGLEDLLGYEHGSLSGQLARVNFASDEAFEAFGRWSDPIIAAGGTAKGEVEYCDSQGQPILAYVSGKAIDPADLTQGVVWMATDIRQQKKDAAELDRARRELQIIFDNNVGAIAVVREGRIERCSRGFLSMYGYAEEEVVGRSVHQFSVSRESSLDLGESTEPELMAGRVVSGEFEYRRKDGSTGWLVFQGRALQPPDLEKGTIWLCQDISKLKGQETALLASKAQVEQSLVEVERANRQVSLLGELTGFLQACSSAEEAFACIGDFGPRLFPLSLGALYLADESGDTWVECGRWGGQEMRQRLISPSLAGSDCWALRRSRVYRVDEPRNMPCCRHLLEPQDERLSYACLPLTAQGRTFGMLHILYRQDLVGSEADRRHGLAVAMAEQIALAIANVQLREALLQQSIRDPLTGLYNRRHLQESLFRELAHSKRNHANLAVLMLDVDHFKRFNDTFGHHAGDLVLQHVARAIEAHFRRSDIACRFGGEEFTVLLPGTDLALAERLADGLLEAIRALQLSHENRVLDRITSSLGIAIFPQHGSTPLALIEAADAALYQAKQSGRNRVAVSGAAVGSA